MATCAKCGKEVAPEFKFCPCCGQKAGTAPRKTRKRANGMGSVYKLSGRRRKAWAASVTREGQRILIGCFAEKREALAALEKVQDQPISSRYNITLGEVYELWSKSYYPTASGIAVNGYKAAWNRLQKYKDMKMRDLRTEHFQEVINNAVYLKKGEETPLSKAGKEKIRALCGQLCKWAMQDDIILKNYAEFLKISAPPPKEKEIFTIEETVLLEQDDSQTARIVLALIFSGMRINELLGMKLENVHLDEGYMVGGEKSEAGRNRLIPIHPKIKGYIAEWVAEAKPGQTYLLVNSLGHKIGGTHFRVYYYYPTLDRLGIPRKVPHCTRHTFATWMRQAGVRPETLVKIIGHSSFSNTQRYLHDDLERLKEAVMSI